MKLTTVLTTFAVAGLTSAFPGMPFPSNNKDKLPTQGVYERAATTSPSLPLGGLLPPITPILSALVNGIQTLTDLAEQAVVETDNLRPQPGYDFIAPLATDSREPCPGLNTLANHGYLPRNGYVTFDKVVEAVGVVYNMSPDLAAILTLFPVLIAGNITAESFYLGTSPQHVSGLNRHSVAVAEYNNYTYYLSPPPGLVAVATYAFYARFFSNGTYGLGGAANYASISSFVGARFNASAGHFQYVPERFPQRWYRRATPYSLADVIADSLGHIYPHNPILPPFNTDNLTPASVLCTILMGIESITPLWLAGEKRLRLAAAAWAIAKLGVYGLNKTVPGCSTSSISPLGGPVEPSPSVFANTGDNVYGKVYFTSAPRQPLCQHTSSTWMVVRYRRAWEKWVMVDGARKLESSLGLARMIVHYLYS